MTKKERPKAIDGALRSVATSALAKTLDVIDRLARSPDQVFSEHIWTVANAAYLFGCWAPFDDLEFRAIRHDLDVGYTEFLYQDDTARLVAALRRAEAAFREVEARTS